MRKTVTIDLTSVLWYREAKSACNHKRLLFKFHRSTSNSPTLQDFSKAGDNY